MFSVAAMKNTGSELISEMVGPAGSRRNEGDFSVGSEVVAEDELWLAPEALGLCC
jgi:hypothetical protein